METNITSPVAQFKAGTVAVAIWENQTDIDGKAVTALRATIQRKYKGKRRDEWIFSNSFGRNDIPLAIHCLQKAFEKIVETQNDASNNGNGNSNSNGKVEEPILDGVM